MSNRFTYVIRDSSREAAVDYTCDCLIRLSGLPTQYKFYDCTVSALHLSTNTAVLATSTIELRADVFDIVNGRDSKGGSLKSLAFASYNNTYSQGQYTFRCSNFNGRSIRFQLYDESGSFYKATYSGLQGCYNSPWILILNIKGVLE